MDYLKDSMQTAISLYVLHSEFYLFAGRVQPELAFLLLAGSFPTSQPRRPQLERLLWNLVQLNLVFIVTLPIYSAKKVKRVLDNELGGRLCDKATGSRKFCLLLVKTPAECLHGVLDPRERGRPQELSYAGQQLPK